MKCDEARDLIDERKETIELKHHLKTCAECDRYALVSHSLSRIKEIDRVPDLWPAFLEKTEKIKPFSWNWAFSGVAVVVLAGLLFFRLNPFESKPVLSFDSVELTYEIATDRDSESIKGSLDYYYEILQ